jgi:drug/metabolite transporter (DMT)-like permease
MTPARSPTPSSARCKGGARAAGQLLQSDNPRNRLIGIGLISVTFLCFALLDCGAKWLVKTVPVLQVVWLRFLFHAVFSTALLAPKFGSGILRTRRPKLQFLRAAMLATMTGLNFWALQYLQLAETGSIQFSVPIIIALIAAPLLGERLDAARWMAVLAGFAGVLVIIRPGTQGFHPALILSLICAVLYALFNLLTRQLAAHDSPQATQFFSSVGATLAITPFALAFWQAPPSMQEWILLCMIGIAGGLGHYLLALAHRHAPASVLGPFLYQQIIWMVLLGYLVFGDVPDAAVVLGATIVIASGGYLLYRERNPR